MKAVMYHYVREFDERFPNFRFLNISNFSKQLDYFEKKFGFVSRGEWEEIIRSKRVGIGEGKVVLTFDDAMSCHFDYVLPELIKRGMWGIFYVPTSPYQDAIMLDVHKIHLLCGALDGMELYRTLETLVTEDMIPEDRRQEFRELTYLNQKNYPGVTEVKRLLNYFISYEYIGSIIEQLGSFYEINFNPSEFYVSTASLADFDSQGMILGSHTRSHPVMSRLSYSEQFEQINGSFEFLDRISSSTLKTYCHPYGGFHSFNSDTLEVLKSKGVSYAFNVESREITDEDIRVSPYCLPRFDCNEFRFGQVS